MRNVEMQERGGVFAKQKIAFNRSHDQPQVSKEGANASRFQDLTSSFVLRLIPLCPRLCCGRVSPEDAERSTRRPPGGKCPLLRSLQVCGSGNLQNLSRRDLQRLGEDAALEDHIKQRRRSLAPGLRRLPWSRSRPRRRGRRHNQDIQSREALGQRGGRQVPDLSRGNAPEL